MTNFEDAIKIGISSATAADANIREIWAVVTDMKTAVLQSTDHKVSIEIQRRPAETQSILRLSTAAFGGKVKMVDALFFKRVDTGSEIELAKLDIPSEGYPCILIVGNRRDTCHDTDSLREALKTTLSSPDAGRALMRLMHQTPAIETKPTPEPE